MMHKFDIYCSGTHGMERIGEESEYEDLPELVSISDSPYILTKSNGEYNLYSAVCPHEQGTVRPQDDESWVCPDHGWRFNGEGKCTTTLGESLESYPIILKDGVLYAEVDESTEDEININNQEGSEPPKITLVSHATLLFEYEGFRLLTDPWIVGEAFQGSWTQYPPTPVEPDEVGEVDAIWITHEHSDHLHPETLAHFDNSTPVYVPEFRCQRLHHRMTELGFTDINVAPNRKPIRLDESVHAICFESQSVWNDTIQYLNFGGFEILNANDAGINRNVKDVIGSVDLVSSVFSQGASGYPLTWTHLSEGEKQRIIKESNEGLLHKIEEWTEIVDPDYILPFASFQALWHPEHEEYLDLQEKNAPEDVVEHLADTDVTVLDLYPGESWDGESIKRREDRDVWYSGNHRERYLREYNNQASVPNPFEHSLTHGQLQHYFEELSESEYAQEAGKLAVSFTANGSDNSPDLHAVIRFNEGVISYIPKDEPVEMENLSGDYSIRMVNPAGHVETVIKQDLSWDEITTGYWGTRSRQPDKYNMSFWKLLCVPWEARREGGVRLDQLEISGKVLRLQTVQ
jgi:CMP-N-acetylneuraminate monooxygenase